MRLASSLAFLLALLVAGAAAPRRAEACGGCFSPPETVTSVDSHRMVVSLTPDRSILWDQIRYSGDPEDFVWVLPVPSPEVQIAVADDLFFAELESQTVPQISPPPLPPLDCPPPPDSCEYCGAAGGSADAGAGAVDGGVDVYREEVVGPYETVVIGSEDPGALVAWLNDHGYAVPESTTPTIRHYTDKGNLFVVLRLAPDQGVSAMQPVRVEYPGYMSRFPLRMVTVGAYSTLSMTLWVVADQRVESRNYPSVEIDPSQLVWDFLEGGSNYRALYRAAIDSAGGKAWVTQFAGTFDSLYFTSEEAATARQTLPYPYLTRLDTEMLVDHVSADLDLEPSAGGYVSNYLQAASYVNDTRTCPDWDGDGDPDTWADRAFDNDRLFGCGCRAGTGTGGGSLLAILGALLIVRRRRPRHR